MSVNGAQKGKFDATGFTASAYTPITITGGTVTVSTPVVTATQTWNDAGVTFTGFDLNVTDTLSAAASLLFNLRKGGTSQFKVDKSGNATALTSLITPIVDSGSTGALSLKTNNGTLGIELIHTSSAVNWTRVVPAATLTAINRIAAGESNTNVLEIVKGTGGFSWDTGATDNAGAGSLRQFEVRHTASATRRIFATGSNGGVPAFGASVGDRVGVASGSGLGVANIGGVLNVTTTAVGNVGAGEDDLMSYLLLANALSVNGKAILIKAWGTAANNANTKDLKIYFGATNLLTFNLTASINSFWEVEAIVARTGSSTQDYRVRWMQVNQSTLAMSAISGIPSTGNAATTTITDSADITIKLTGTATSNNDIVQEGMTVEYLS